MSASGFSIDDTKIVLANHATFYAIANQHYRHVLELVKERDAKPVKTDADADFVALKNAEIQHAAMVVVVFSALTVEAFINYYGIDRFSKNFFEEHLDKLSTKSKWLIVPKLLIGAEIPRDGQAYEGIVKLFKLRDKLVHYKARTKRIRDLREDEDWVTEKHARDALQTVELGAHALKAVDANLDIDWLETAKTDPFV